MGKTPQSRCGEEAEMHPEGGAPSPLPQRDTAVQVLREVPAALCILSVLQPQLALSLVTAENGRLP